MIEHQAQASDVAAEQNVVTMDGPAGIAVTLTPDAADETADRLKDAARRARSQQETE